MSTRYSPDILARAALSRLFEPSDTVGVALAGLVGPVDALRVATGDVIVGRNISAELREHLGLQGARRDPLTEGLARWRPRCPDLAPERDLDTLGRLGGRLVTPGTEEWPEALDDLRATAPLCLWVRGRYRIPGMNRLAAVVGSRDSTPYGSTVTADLASGMVTRGYGVVSGGAYGIDAQAHRAALATGAGGQLPPTIAVLANGVDRYYPAGNEDLLRAVAEQGILISEMPPGSSPTRWRFLQRNRLIAALSAVTVVVEARWRSGALNTAHHAAGLGRPVGAVPGSVHSANSAGCHRLLRDGTAVCVTDAPEIAELAGPLGAVEDPDLVKESAAPSRDHDGLLLPDLLVLDSLPVRVSASVDKLATVAGLSVRDVIAGLTRLELAGLAARTGEGWSRRRT